MLTLVIFVVLLVGAGWLLYPFWDDSTRAAERRWRRSNRQAKAAGCRCGKPATHVQQYSDVKGRVPYEVWTCAEHYGVAAWSGDGKTMTPRWPRSQPCETCVHRVGFIEGATQCGGTMTKIGAETPHQWHCPLKPITHTARTDPDEVTHE